MSSIWKTSNQVKVYYKKSIRRRVGNNVSVLWLGLPDWPSAPPTFVAVVIVTSKLATWVGVALVQRIAEIQQAHWSRKSQEGLSHSCPLRAGADPTTPDVEYYSSSNLGWARPPSRCPSGSIAPQCESLGWLSEFDHQFASKRHDQERNLGYIQEVYWRKSVGGNC
ncbi:hypothetical protein B0H10DRAFT_1938059 [Mycena sp. CBHHK59/15]|nr:hypothetical protein B0H10DRAFT_1938059 [Mycena sp. CBHHK59/15]